MTQWYPKLAEYDEDGWHADQYVGREFYGVWGSFDVKIHINRNYVLGGTATYKTQKMWALVMAVLRFGWVKTNSALGTLPLRKSMISLLPRILIMLTSSFK